MNYFKLLCTAFLTAVLCVTLATSCSEEDDNPDNLQDGKRLSKIEHHENDGWISTFQYANGKLVKAKWHPSAGFVNITYSGSKVTVIADDDEDGEGGFGLTFQLNSNGFAESGTITLYDDYTGTFTCEYSNGYLTKINFDYPASEDDSRIEINYDNNGNILTACRYYYDQWREENRTEEVGFTSSDYPTQGKSYFLLGDCFGSDYALDLFWPAYYAGILGKDPQNLASKYEYNDGPTNSFSFTKDFNYTFDDGYVETMKIKLTYPSGNFYEDNVSFTYE